MNIKQIRETMNCTCACTCVKEQQYCCDIFEEMDKDYCSYERTFYLPDCSPINFCPGCGKGMPKSLESEWKETLMKDYGIEEDHCSIWNPMVPEEFKSDAWWKNRGL